MNAPLIVKKHVAAAFSRAASTYDAAAHLQRDVGETLWQYLAEVVVSGSAPVMDLGCGTGYFTARLKRWGAPVYAVDFAQGMLDFTRARLGSGYRYVRADAEALPFARASMGGVFSSLALQWCEDLPRLSQSLASVIQPGGWLAIASLGPKTLHELRHAWTAVDDHVHVNRFLPGDAVLAALDQAGFECVVSRQSSHQLYYASVPDLLRELKALGVNNHNAGRDLGLSGRKKLSILASAYQHFHQSAGLPATYDVLYWVLKRRAN